MKRTLLERKEDNLSPLKKSKPKPSLLDHLSAKDQNASGLFLQCLNIQETLQCARASRFLWQNLLSATVSFVEEGKTQKLLTSSAIYPYPNATSMTLKSVNPGISANLFVDSNHFPRLETVSLQLYVSSFLTNSQKLRSFRCFGFTCETNLFGFLGNLKHLDIGKKSKATKFNHSIGLWLKCSPELQSLRLVNLTSEDYPSAQNLFTLQTYSHLQKLELNALAFAKNRHNPIRLTLTLPQLEMLSLEQLEWLEALCLRCPLVQHVVLKNLNRLEYLEQHETECLEHLELLDVFALKTWNWSGQTNVLQSFAQPIPLAPARTTQHYGSHVVKPDRHAMEVQAFPVLQVLLLRLTKDQYRQMHSLLLGCSLFPNLREHACWLAQRELGAEQNQHFYDAHEQTADPFVPWFWEFLEFPLLRQVATDVSILRVCCDSHPTLDSLLVQNSRHVELYNLPRLHDLTIQPFPCFFNQNDAQYRFVLQNVPALEHFEFFEETMTNPVQMEFAGSFSNLKQLTLSVMEDVANRLCSFDALLLDTLQSLSLHFAYNSIYDFSNDHTQEEKALLARVSQLTGLQHWTISELYLPTLEFQNIVLRTLCLTSCCFDKIHISNMPHLESLEVLSFQTNASAMEFLFQEMPGLETLVLQTNARVYNVVVKIQGAPLLSSFQHENVPRTPEWQIPNNL